MPADRGKPGAAHRAALAEDGSAATQPGQRVARIPGHGLFFLTAPAVEMVAVFGGTLHCYQGNGGCRKQGLYFSRTPPRKPLWCELSPPPTEHPGNDGRGGGTSLKISVSHDLAPTLDRAVLDFGTFNKMQRFVWLSLPAVRGPQCSCHRSTGAPAGKRSPCLDDEGIGLTDL